MTAITLPVVRRPEIPAFLTLPVGVPAKNLPTIVVPHGGPWARDGGATTRLAQFLANRGYAVLQPNFRGSTGYGKKFLNAGNRQWGEKMQDDLTWGVKHLVAQGHRRSEAGRHHGRHPTAATRRWPASPSRPTSTPPASRSSARRT